MKTGVEKGAGRRTDELDEQVPAGPDNRVREFAHSTEGAYHRTGFVGPVVNPDIVVRAVLRTWGGEGNPGKSSDDPEIKKKKKKKKTTSLPLFT